jgi:hypothetical protein
MPLVLVHNEVVRDPENHTWNNVEGVHYHYPSKYRGLVQTGVAFVYYRGVARKNGKRGPAQYLGAGRIGDIWPDPERPRRWYCALESYDRFPAPVPAKVDGVNLEPISGNAWWDGVRSLSQGIYDQVVGLGTVAAGLAEPVPVPAGEVVISTGDNLVIPPRQRTVSGSPGGTTYRRSKRAKFIGDWAESIALRFIREQVEGATVIEHRAANGETPGWDIDYVDAQGVLQRVEVKGTVAAGFTGVDLTAGELLAAAMHGPEYSLCLVASCLTDGPKIQMIRDPVARLKRGEWIARASVVGVSFASALGNAPAMLDLGFAG